MTSDDHRARRDDLAAYSLDALEPVEVEELELHLAECGECREYLSWLDPAVDLLPTGVAQRRPPRGLKKSLMGEVREDLRAVRRAEGHAKRSGRRGFMGVLWRPATAIAAGIVLIAGAIGGYALRGEPQDPPESVMIAAAEGTGKVPVQATLEVSDERGTLHVDRMPGLPSNSVYQAWIQRDGEMEPSTVFVVKGDGTAEVAIDGSLDGAEGVYVTTEPRGGSVEPTLPAVTKALL